MTEFWRWTAEDSARRVRAREVSAAEVAESALARLDAVNPAISAVVDALHDEARAAAAEVDAALARGDDPGPLAGVPVTVKVNVDQKGRATTNGVRLQAEHVAAEDNPVVANLRKAGAVILGRTNTPAFSLRWFCRNSLHGATKNPRDPSLTPGGSSGGAAAATAAGVGAVGHGTDIAGSIRYPAYACGLHGLRPSLGRVPAANLSLPDRHIGAQLMAVSGPIARSIGDIRLAFAAMAAPDPRDSWQIPLPLAAGDIPRRVAYCPTPDGLTPAPAILAALEDAAARLRDAGWTVEETACPPLREALAPHLRLWMAEFRRARGKAIEAEDDPDATFIYQQLCARGPEADADALLDALQLRSRLVREWRLFFAERPVMLCPVSGETPFEDQADVSGPGRFAEVFEAQLLQVAAPFMGLPGMTVATAGADSAPMGVQLLAAPWRDDALLAAAEAIAARGPDIAPVDPA